MQTEKWDTLTDGLGLFRLRKSGLMLSASALAAARAAATAPPRPPIEPGFSLIDRPRVAMTAK